MLPHSRPFLPFGLLIAAICLPGLYNTCETRVWRVVAGAVFVLEGCETLKIGE